MIKYRINRKVVEQKMAYQFMNFKELAEKMAVSQSKMNFIISRGSKSHAEPLAKVLGGEPEDFIIIKEEK